MDRMDRNGRGGLWWKWFFVLAALWVLSMGLMTTTGLYHFTDDVLVIILSMPLCFVLLPLALILVAVKASE